MSFRGTCINFNNNCYVNQLLKNYSCLYLSVWCPDKGVLLEQLYQSHLSLQQSKPHPYAVARTKSKWHVSKLWPLGSLLWGKPIYTQQSRIRRLHAEKHTLKRLGSLGTRLSRIACSKKLKRLKCDSLFLYNNHYTCPG